MLACVLVPYHSTLCCPHLMLTGSSYWNYVTHLAQDGLTTGYRSVVMNQRGIASIPMGVSVLGHNHIQ